MTNTLESLSISQSALDNGEYDRRRAQKVQEVTDYIRDFLKDPKIADAVAESIMATAEEMGRINGDEINGEVASRYTASGNPLPFTI